LWHERALYLQFIQTETMLRAQAYARNVADLHRLKEDQSLVQNMEWGLVEPLRRILEQTLSSTDLFDVSVYRSGQELLRVARPLRHKESQDPITIHFLLGGELELRASYPRPRLTNFEVSGASIRQAETGILLSLLGLTLIFAALLVLGRKPVSEVEAPSPIVFPDLRP
jgi:hypothetical protein